MKLSGLAARKGLAMPTFEYVALQTDGRKSSGVVTADTARAARKELRFRNLTPVSVVEARDEKANLRRPNGLSMKDRVLVTRQLAMMLDGGVRVEHALGAVSAQAEKPAVRRLFASLRDDVAEGHKLSEAIAEHPKAFPDLFPAVIFAGEISGDLANVLDRLASYLELSHKTRRKVQTALIYPAVLGVVAVIVIGLLMAFVVPRMVEQFANFGQELPLLTRIVIAVSGAVQSYGIFMLIGAVLAVFGLRRLFANETVRRWTDAKLMSWPVIGKLIRSVNGARFARTFAMLVGGGAPVVESLTAARGSVGNLVFKDAIDEAIAAVREGAGPAQALSRSQVFPPMLTSLMASGTASDNLANLMDKGAGYLEEEFDGRIAILLGLLEPLIIIFLGSIVALIVLSIMLPIMQLNSFAFN